MNHITQALEECSQFVEENLAEMCGELLAYQDTGILKSDGIVRRAASKLTAHKEFDYKTAFDLVESFIHEYAMAFTIVNWSAKG